MITHLLFDMDGTLTNPFLGITGAYRAMLEDLGRPVPPAEELRWTIGPAMRVCLQKMLETTDPTTIENAVRIYRHHYVEKKLMFGDRPYPGIPELLQRLVDAGYTCLVATSKAQPIARIILEHFRLDGFFAGIYGAGLDGSFSRKADLLAHLLRERDVGPDSALMIGDRHHDIDAGRERGLATIGVRWGFAAEGELETAGAHRIAGSVEELWSEIAALVESSKSRKHT